MPVASLTACERSGRWSLAHAWNCGTPFHPSESDGREVSGRLSMVVGLSPARKATAGPKKKTRAPTRQKTTVRDGLRCGVAAGGRALVVWVMVSQNWK